MQKHGQLHHFTYIILSIRNKSDYIAHQTLLFFKPLSSHPGFCSPSVRSFSWHWPQCHQPGTECPLQPGAVTGEELHMSTLGQPGTAACTCLALLGLSAFVSSGDPPACALWFWIKLVPKSTIFTDISCMLWRHSVIKLQCMP